MDKVQIIGVLVFGLVLVVYGRCPPDACERLMEMNGDCPNPECGHDEIFMDRVAGRCQCCGGCLRLIGEGGIGCMPIPGGARFGVCDQGLVCEEVDQWDKNALYGAGGKCVREF